MQPVPAKPIAWQRWLTAREITMNKAIHAAAALLVAMAAGAAPAQDAAAPNDAQIAAIVVTANNVDINAGKLAEGKTKNAEVKSFAQQMVHDHMAVNKQATDLVKKLKVTPQTSPTNDKLKSDGQAAIKKLQKLSGAAFDKAYVDNEVTYHQQVVDAIDQVLMPNVKNEDLKNTLVQVRPAIVAHLEHAKHLQAAMK